MNPNLTLENLRELGEARLQALQSMGDKFIEGLERIAPEDRARYVCEVLPIFTQLYCAMMVW